MTADLAYPKCPKCGSTSRECWRIKGKDYQPRNMWHRERKQFDARRVRCEYCGAEPGEACVSDGGNQLSQEHKDRRHAHRVGLLASVESYNRLPF